jgi:hypothetical protein
VVSECYLHVEKLEKLEKYVPKPKQEENKVTLMERQARVGKGD